MSGVPAWINCMAWWGAPGGDELLSAVTGVAGYETLAATGAGTWAAADDHEAIYAAGDYAITDPIYAGILVVRALFIIQGSGAFSWRLYDVTNTTTLVQIDWTGGTRAQAVITSPPASDARVQLQYNLVSPSTAGWWGAAWWYRIIS